jgi:hypothetical protein
MLRASLAGAALSAPLRCVCGPVKGRPHCRDFHPADKPEAPTARTPSTGCARAERHLRTKNHARVFRDAHDDGKSRCMVF